jgi:hypothetical protein
MVSCNKFSTFNLKHLRFLKCLPFKFEALGVDVLMYLVFL